MFDSSSKGHNGLSLNDHLEKGPNYINNLPNVLTAWRWDEVAYAGDIRKMFNQVLVHHDDQVFHRFLWRKNQHDPPTVYQWLRLNFGGKPAPDIASNTINILARASKDEFPEAAKELQERTYVDDIGGSRPTVLQRPSKSQLPSTKCSERVSSRLKHVSQTVRRSTKPVVNATQICWVIGGTSKKTHLL